MRERNSRRWLRRLWPSPHGQYIVGSGMLSPKKNNLAIRFVSRSCKCLGSHSPLSVGATLDGVGWSVRKNVPLGVISKMMHAMSGRYILRGVYERDYNTATAHPRERAVVGRDEVIHRLRWNKKKNHSSRVTLPSSCSLRPFGAFRYSRRHKPQIEEQCSSSSTRARRYTHTEKY